MRVTFINLYPETFEIMTSVLGFEYRYKHYAGQWANPVLPIDPGFPQRKGDAESLFLPAASEVGAGFVLG